MGKNSMLEVDMRHDWVREKLETIPPNQMLAEIVREYGVSKDTAYRYLREVREENEHIKKYAGELAARKLSELKVEMVAELQTDIEKSKIAEGRIWSMVATLKDKLDQEDDPKRYTNEIKELIAVEIKNREARQRLYKTIDDLIGKPMPENQINIQNNSYELKWGK